MRKKPVNDKEDSGINEIGLYNNFIKNIGITSIVLIRTNVIRHTEPFCGDWKYDISSDFKLDSIKNCELKAKAIYVLNAHGHKETNDCQSKNVDNGNQSEKIKLFDIKIIYLLSYHYPEKIKLPKNLVQKFIDTNVKINSWPYAREMISSLSTRMDYPALVIKPAKVLR